MNPFRIEGQKSIVFEMLDQRDWRCAGLDRAARWKSRQHVGVRQRPCAKHARGADRQNARLAVIQAEGSAPFYELFTPGERRDGDGPVTKPETLATAIRIGDPVSWPKACTRCRPSGGTVEKVTEQEIADAKAQIGRAGSAASPLRPQRWREFAN